MFKNKYLKYKKKYINLKNNINNDINNNIGGEFWDDKEFNDNNTVFNNLVNLYNNYTYDTEKLKILKSKFYDIYDFIINYINFLNLNFIKFDIKNKNIKKITSLEFIPCYSIKLHFNDSNEKKYYIEFINDGKKEISFDIINEEYLYSKKFEYYANTKGIILYQNKNFDKIAEFYIFSRYNKFDFDYNELFIKLFIKKEYNLIIPDIFSLGGRTGNSLFQYFYTMDAILKTIELYYDKIKKNSEILLIEHSSLREIKINNNILNDNEFKLYFSEILYNRNYNPYNFIIENKVNLFNIKKHIEIVFDTLLTNQIKNLKITHNKKIIGLHFRGSDFCVTSENIKSPGSFKVMHFKFYYDCLNDIIKKNSDENNFEVHIYSHPNDRSTINLMVNYLNKKFIINLSNINITFKHESEICKEYLISNPNEYDIIKLLSTYQYIILSNSSFALWAGFLSDSSSVLYMCTSENIIPNLYVNSFEQLNLYHNTVIKNPTEIEYALCCYINLNLYIKKYAYTTKYYYNKFNYNYFDLIIILNSIINIQNKCNPKFIFELGKKQYETNFGIKNNNYAQNELNIIYKNKVEIIEKICLLGSDDNYLDQIIKCLNKNNSSKLYYNLDLDLLYSSNIPLCNEEYLIKDDKTIIFIYFIILLYIIKKNDTLFCEVIESFTPTLTFESFTPTLIFEIFEDYTEYCVIESIVYKFINYIICEIKNHKK